MLGPSDMFARGLRDDYLICGELTFHQSNNAGRSRPVRGKHDERQGFVRGSQELEQMGCHLGQHRWDIGWPDLIGPFTWLEVVEIPM